MRSSGWAGGSNELAKASMSSRNLVSGIPLAFFPSVMDSREMLAIFSSLLLASVGDLKAASAVAVDMMGL